jgi:hypothetical protein
MDDSLLVELDALVARKGTTATLRKSKAAHRFR